MRLRTRPQLRRQEIACRHEPFEHLPWDKHESQTGLLLPRGPEQAGAHHVSIQKFLAAQRVWDLDSDKLADVFRRRAAVPEWHNTLSFVP